MEIRGGKRFRTKAERRQIVEETLKPGASVSRVARAHDVNTNQVFGWRLQYRVTRHVIPPVNPKVISYEIFSFHSVELIDPIGTG